VPLVAGHDPHVLDDELRAEWDELADRTGATPFVRAGWLEPWHRAFGDGELGALVTRRDGRLTGLLPVTARRGALVSPTNWHTPMFGPVAEDADAVRGLTHELLSRARRRADIWFLEAGSPALEQCAAAAAEARSRSIVRTIARAPYVPVDGPFEEYMGGLDRKFRKEIGRLWRRLEERGDVQVSYEQGSERLDDLLTEGFALEGSGWKAEGGTAILSASPVERFYREVARWTAERGWLRLAFLRLDGRALAFDMCLEHGGAFYVLKGGFDIDERKAGPGTLLTHHGVERAFELGLDSYELLGQADDYKRSWTSLARERVRFQAFPRRPAGALEYLAWRYGRPLAKRVLRTTGEARPAAPSDARLSGSSSSPNR
jgi:CelD/BcsL family acetyltransferase involved in cellulose biosynthesis